MNIKDLGNYELVNGNTDSPILIGTPKFYNFSIQTKTAVDPTSTRPMFDAATQVEMKDDLLTLLEDASIALDQNGDGCGYWWYIIDVKSEYIIKSGVAGYFMVLSATVISVGDNNIPATSPSGV
jgi:hypothetical protein